LNNFAIQETDSSLLPCAANFYAFVVSCTWQWKCLPEWWENSNWKTSWHMPHIF